MQKELRRLLDSLLLLQQSLLSRHRDTESLAVGASAGSGERDEEPSSDEEVPSDLESDEDEGSGREGGGEEGVTERVEEDESQQQKRQQRKRKCPWVCYFLSLDIPFFVFTGVTRFASAKLLFLFSLCLYIFVYSEHTDTVYPL